MKHVTCLAHTLHRVAKEIKIQISKNQLIYFKLQKNIPKGLFESSSI